MSIRRSIRPLVFVAASVSLLGTAAACSGGSPTGADAMNVANPPVRDTSGFIPTTPTAHP
jgi:hypothetical protein